MIVVSLVVLSATTAWAQFGLYGSPEVLRLPQADPAVVPGPYAAQPTVAYTSPASSYVMPSLQATYTGQRGAIPAAPAPPTPPGGPAVLPPAQDPAAAHQAGAPGPLTQAVASFEQAVCGEGGCGGMPAACCPWYASAYALYMGRNAANRLWVTSRNEVNLQHTDLDLDWSWGGEIRFGRRFCCDQWALEATYWTLEGFSGFSRVRDPAGLVTPLDFTLATAEVTFGGAPATNWFDGALEHRVSRYNEIHNVELDLVRQRVFLTSELPWDVDWSVGIRYFHFNESLIFASLRGGGDWAVPADAAYLDDEVTNDLLGFQFGFDANYYLHPALRFFLTPKFGIYNNAIDHDFRLYLGDGTNADVRDPGTGAVIDTFPVHSTTNTVSFLMEVDLGLDWRLSERWSARAGYRVVVVTGVGLADNQIPPFITDVPEIADIDTNGELILHGALFGLTYNF